MAADATGSSASSSSTLSRRLLASDAFSHVAFSSCAAIVARTLAHPLDTLKTRIQFESAAGSSTSSVGHLRSTVRNILRTESFTALYRGLPVALVFSVPALSVYLGAYDQSKVLLARWGGLGDESSIGVHAVASCNAEILSGALWTPMEVLKNKMQVQTVDGMSKRGVSTWSLCRSIYARDGIRGFFKGYFLALGVFVPYTMTYFIAYEQLKRQADLFINKRTASVTTSTPKQLPFGAYMLCAGTSGALAGAVSNALDIVKTRRQAGGGTESAVTIIKDMWRNEGKWRAFGRGLAARVLWVTPTVTLSMSVYEILKDWRARTVGDIHSV
ncbi:mitochondrial carrier domain-containing protein [Fimicolochytrium jonesii]|uniref:mitochondrial carrier domain-containing protein n=1 Tax=Fimicolochytrium jonesii TaxID=1396493 RepID=UPI0022FEDD1F|nr:mitochondrial carrier domain-containing protein [Fimicolochytrium jonesii]KAI8827267.1 mitochondrial carrier domain-containing protein [Fimicolochytrium jonesii]